MFCAQAVSGQPVPRPASLRRDVPREWESICMRCLAKNPAERFSSALELWDAISHAALPGTLEACPTLVRGEAVILQCGRVTP